MKPAARARDVDVLADQVGIDALREVDLREVDVFNARIHLGGEVVAQPLGIHAERQDTPAGEMPVPRLLLIFSTVRRS